MHRIATATLALFVVTAMSMARAQTIILDWTTLATGDFTIGTEPPLGGTLRWDYSNLLVDGTIAAIPEPATALLLLASAATALCRSRRLSVAE